MNPSGPGALSGGNEKTTFWSSWNDIGFISILLSSEDTNFGMASRRSTTCEGEGAGNSAGARRFLKNLTPSSLICCEFVKTLPVTESLILKIVLAALFCYA